MENKFRGKALNDNVIVFEILNENKTASGFDLTGITDVNESQKKGFIVALGELCPKLNNGESTIKLGDEIIFTKHRIDPFTQDGVRYLIIKYQDIVLVF